MAVYADLSDSALAFNMRCIYPNGKAAYACRINAIRISMKRSSPNKKPLIITAVAAALLLILVIAGSASGRAGFLGNTVGRIFSPIQRAASSVTGAVGGFFSNIFSKSDADEENERLNSELALMKRSLAELEELRRENERLRGLLAFAESAGIESGVTARIIGLPSSVYFRVYTLNVGSSKGVDINMPVVNADGLVGIVSDVGSNWCKVTAVTDSSVSVPVMVERTRDTCIAHGVLNAAGDANRMELLYLPADRSDIVPGDILITSGIGGVYPKGIRLGTVTEVMTGKAGGISAYVAPLADFAHLEELMIVTAGGGEG